MANDSTPSAEKRSPTHAEGSVKETIESILVAFVLAFIFRAFVVEAFVIPTGSMAPTLMGAHMRFQCPDCGYKFDVNWSSPSAGDSDDIDIRANAGRITLPLYCPNCGFQMDPSQVENPAVYYGDRILVLKYLYLFQQPSRWDVVVFKSPVSPGRYNYGQNYIKRLIGKPGEAIMVLDGDVYVRAPNAKSANDFTVQTKPKHVQDALWRLVYDNDYRPQNNLDRGNVPSFHLPWTASDGTGWNVNDMSHGRVFGFDNNTGGGTLRFEPNANPTAQTTSDFLIYDIAPPNTKHPSGVYPEPWEFPVSDLDLQLTYERTAGDGPLSLTLTKRNHAFTAEITPTDATLFHIVNGERVKIGRPMPLDHSSRPVRVELSNADYQVTLRIDDKIAAQTTPADYAPDLKQLLQEYRSRVKGPPPRVEIAADRQRCQLSHLSLWRDVFYYNSSPGVRWATPDSFPENAQLLGPDEFFVMGDNSLVSYDARCWTEPIELPGEDLRVDAGRVPARFMLGKAFFVYWPAGYRPLSNVPAAFVPNFGDMRMIH